MRRLFKGHIYSRAAFFFFWSKSHVLNNALIIITIKTQKAKSTVFILLRAAGVYHIFSVFDAAFIQGPHLLEGGVFFFLVKIARLK